MGTVGRCPGKSFRDCLPALYVRHNPHCGVLFQTRDAARLAGGVYDVQCAFEPAAHYVFHRFGRDGAGDPHCVLHGLRHCGTIPLIREWLAMGMSMGSASAFMITGPATKITNLGALKIVLGLKRFLLYLTFVIAFSLATGELLIWLRL